MDTRKLKYYGADIPPNVDRVPKVKLVVINGVATYVPVSEIGTFPYCELFTNHIPYGHGENELDRVSLRRDQHSLLFPKKSNQRITKNTIRDITRPDDIFIGASLEKKIILNISVKFSDEENNYTCGVEVGSDKLYLVNYVDSNNTLVSFIGKAKKYQEKRENSFSKNIQCIIIFDASEDFESVTHYVSIPNIRYIAEVIYDANDEIDFSMWTDPRVEITYKVKKDELHNEYYIIGVDKDGNELPFIHIPLSGDIRKSLDNILLTIHNHPDSVYFNPDATPLVLERYGEPDE